MRTAHSKQKGVKRFIFGNYFGLIVAWSTKKKDYWYENEPGDKPPVWFQVFNGEVVIVWCLYIFRAYVALFVKI